jgi:L-ribulose-5-phosphate 3-epimerase
MNLSALADRIAVCSWSLQPANPQDLLSKLQATGVKRLQLALDPLREHPDTWGGTATLLKENGFSVVSGMFGCVGEDYTTLESIRATGGVAPDATWDQNLKNIQASAVLCGQLGLKLVAFHAGFLPHDETDPAYVKMLRRLTEVAGIFEKAKITLCFETGQETAPLLLEMLSKFRQTNLGVNFDPANMILYDKGNPIEALRTLGRWVRQLHIKDATRTRVPGTWGQEVPVGTGEVDWPALFTTLKDLNFSGNLVIEREAGDQRVADVIKAKQLIERLGAK